MRLNQKIKGVWRLIAAACLCAGLSPFAHAQADGQSPAGEPGVINLNLTEDCWVTLAINNRDGVRVRNLMGEVAMKSGTHKVEWDGRDDAGKQLPPGDYQWVGLTRGKLSAIYQGTFQQGTPPWMYGATGGWTGDHSPSETVVSVGDRMLIGTTEAEWGSGLIACNLDGRKQWGVRWLNKKAWCGASSLVSIGNRVFASSFTKANTLWEVNASTGESKIILEEKDIPAGQISDKPRLPGLTRLGLRIIGGWRNELYVADICGQEPRTYVFDIGARASALKLLRTLPVRPWSLAWLPDGRCLAAMDSGVDVLDTQSGRTSPLIGTGLSCPWGIVCDAKGRIYVSDQGGAGTKYAPDGQLPWLVMRLNGEPSHQVKIFDSTGRLLRVMGQKGGQPNGVIDPYSFYRPAGMALDSHGRLWVTELTMCPRRVSVWSIPDDPAAATPALAAQFIGPAMYGGGAAMIDPEQPWRLMDTNFGVIFDVNLQTGRYDPVELPWRYYDVWKGHDWRPELPFAGKPTTVFKLDGRRFAACHGGYGHGPDSNWEPTRFGATGPVMIGEYRGETFVPQAAIGNIRMWMRSRELNARREEQWLSPVILDAARRLADWPRYAAAMKMSPDDADVPHTEHKRNDPAWLVHPWPREISGFLWVDANGDARLQAEEISFQAIGDFDDIALDSQLNAYFTVPKRDGPGAVYCLSRDGFNSARVPSYSWRNLRQIGEGPFDVAQIGEDGSMLGMLELRDKQGRLRWHYPSDRKGAKDLGRDKERELWPGSVYRLRGLRGVAPGPGDLGDLFLAQSTEGMCYLFTRDDGLFIGTVFRPYAFAAGLDTLPEAKKGSDLIDYSLQNECFNGSFTRAAADGRGFEKGHYYLAGFGRSLIFELTGLDSIRRFSGGTISLVEGAGLYGKPKQPPAPAGPLLIAVSQQQSAPARRGAPKPLKIPHGSQSSEIAAYEETQTFISWDARGLLLKWQVKNDASPFVNAGQDMTMLFTTGDACDFQVDSPVFGKCRFVITTFMDKPCVISMKYDVKNSGNEVVYKSDVGETRVPDVQKLDIPVSVRKLDNSYVVQLIMPWTILGFDPRPGLEIPAEFGILRSDPSGNRTVSRQYWFSGASDMVSDVPTEAQPTKERGKLILK